MLNDSNARAPSLLVGLAALEPVALDDEGEWACAHCKGSDRRGGFMPGDSRGQWRWTGEFVVDHEDECAWLAAAKWLAARGLGLTDG